MFLIFGKESFERRVIYKTRVAGVFPNIFPNHYV